ncbi:MAG: SufS family cysteine desulfurase [Gammaproteobacteria bacterium]|jgi:cysteine desulfurase/selenocysteine lyase
MSAALEINGNSQQGNAWKADFPALVSIDGMALHYLDNAATTQKPVAVIEAMKQSIESGQGSVHRGLYPLAESASLAYEAARNTIAGFIGAPHSDQLIFTRSATESINMVAWGWLQPRLKPADRVWVTRMEHHANFLPWQRVCAQTGAELRIIELNENGSLDFEGADELFDPRTGLIALCHVSNVLGIENPVRTICERAASVGIPVLVDAAQSVSHMPVDVTALGCDFLAFSAHKLYGPAGIGVLFGKKQCLEAMEPLLVGGGMVDRVDDATAQWAPVPARFEAGSPNLLGAVGFAAAVDWLSAIGMDKVNTRVSALTRKAVDVLASVPGLQLLPGAGAERSAIVSFVLEGIHPHDIAQVAGERGVALRAGHHCCQPLLHHLGLTATARASLGIYNDDADIAALVDAIQEAKRLFS